MSATTQEERERARIKLTALSYRGYDLGTVSLGFMDRLLDDADRLAELERVRGLPIDEDGSEMNDEIDTELDERLVTNLVNRAVDHEDERTIMSEAYWKERAEQLEAALREASELIYDLVDDGAGEVYRVQRLVRTELAPQPEPTAVERAEALAALDRLRSFTDEDYCESDHARWYDAGLARRYIERQSRQGEVDEGSDGEI